MRERRLVIVGGGLAGLAAGCYAQRSGFRTTIVEHNLALGGVCTAWHRGPYTVDGCIYWLVGGPFARIYEELGILPTVAMRTLETWSTYRDARDGQTIAFTRDIDALIGRLTEVSPADAGELARVRHGVDVIGALQPPIEPPELASLGEIVRSFWQMRSAITSIVHFRKPLGAWADEHLHSEQLRRIFTCMLPPTVPAFFMLMVLSYLERGYLSRPVGGSGVFRDALESSYRALGGEVLLNSTVDEIVVRDHHAAGVRLADGTLVDADAVLSTSSVPETVLRLLGGRYEADATRARLAHWKLFDPIVLASFGVDVPYKNAPSLQIIDAIRPFEIGGRMNDSLNVRVFNDEPTFAPPGQTIVQVMLSTQYDWWAKRGTRYVDAKDAVAETVLTQLEPFFVGLRAAVKMTDVSTPLTYWNMTHAWNGSYEGWQPNAESMFASMKKRLAGLEGFYMAGQWVEPGGGVPTAVLSGRQAIELLCEDTHRPFVAASPSA